MKTYDTAMSQLIMPVGSLKWVFHRKLPFEVNGIVGQPAEALVVGPYDKAIHISSKEDLEMITVFFQPYAAKTIMSIPGKEFYNETCDFDNLGSIHFHDLKARILNAASAEEGIGMIEQFK